MRTPLRRPALVLGLASLVAVAALTVLALAPDAAADPVPAGGGSCGPGRNCRAATFTATSTTSPFVMPSEGEFCLDGAACTSSLASVPAASAVQLTTGGALSTIRLTPGNGGTQIDNWPLNFAGGTTSYLRNTGGGPDALYVYDAQGLCVSDGTGSVSTCDGFLEAGDTGVDDLNMLGDIGHSTGAAVTIQSTDVLAHAGVATAGLPACNNTAPPTGTRGGVAYDTDEGRLKMCDGSAYGIVSHTTSSLSGYTINDTEAAPFAATALRSDVTSVYHCFTVVTPGVGAGNAIPAIYNSTAAANMDTGSLVCASAVGVVSCRGPQAVTGNASDVIHLRWDATSACTTLPIGNYSVRFDH